MVCCLLFEMGVATSFYQTSANHVSCLFFAKLILPDQPTLTLRLKEHFGEDVSILYHDNYYKQHDDMPYQERCRLNYDHPDAFDTELLIADLQALRRGEAVHSPTYDYTGHNRAAETVEVRPGVILVEGILIFARGWEWPGHS